MEEKTILIVDDEKNIRLTMLRALEPLGMPMETAVNGEEALRKIQEKPFWLLFLDLKLPGMEGMDVLRRIKEFHPRIRVVVITAHGTISSAVEAMKLGAADFIQKPFSPKEIQETARLILERESLDVATAASAQALAELTKRHISDRDFTAAGEIIRKAIAADPGRPEPYNLLGALLEIKGDIMEAQKFYRAALEIDPTFKPALANLDRVTSWNKFGGIDFGTTIRNDMMDNGQSEAGKTDGN